MDSSPPVTQTDRHSPPVSQTKFAPSEELVHVSANARELLGRLDQLFVTTANSSSSSPGGSVASPDSSAGEHVSTSPHAIMQNSPHLQHAGAGTCHSAPVTPADVAWGAAGGDGGARRKHSAMELRVRRDLEERSKRLIVELERGREKARAERERAKLISAAASTAAAPAVEVATAPASVSATDQQPATAVHLVNTYLSEDIEPSEPNVASTTVFEQPVSGGCTGDEQLDWRTPTKISLQPQRDQMLVGKHGERDRRNKLALSREDKDILQHAAFLGVDTALAMRSPSLSYAGYDAKARGGVGEESHLLVAAEAEAALIPLARDALMTPTAALPNGWEKVILSGDVVDCETGAGGVRGTDQRFCYRNALTGEVSSEHPVDAAARLAIQAKRDALLEVELDFKSDSENEEVAETTAKVVAATAAQVAAERSAMSRADTESGYALELPAHQCQAQDELHSFAQEVRDHFNDGHAANSSLHTTATCDEKQAISPSTLENAWEECWDAEHNHPFWFNSLTGVSTWERPADCGDDASTSSSDGGTIEGAGVVEMEHAENLAVVDAEAIARTDRNTNANVRTSTDDTANAETIDEVSADDGAKVVTVSAAGQSHDNIGQTKRVPLSAQLKSVDVNGGGLQDVGAVGLHCPPSAPKALALDGYGSVCAGCACPIDDGHGISAALRTAQNRADCANCGLGFCVECLLHAGRLSFYAQYCAGTAADSLQPLCGPCYEHLQGCCATEGGAPGQMPRFARHFELASTRGIPRRCGFWRAALPPESGKIVGRPLSAPRVVFSEHCLRCGSNTQEAATQGMGLFQSMIAAAVGVTEELHCRACGYSFCHRCLPHMLSLPFCQFEDHGPQPVCADCFKASQFWVDIETD